MCSAMLFVKFEKLLPVGQWVYDKSRGLSPHMFCVYFNHESNEFPECTLRWCHPYNSCYPCSEITAHPCF